MLEESATVGSALDLMTFKTLIDQRLRDLINNLKSLSLKPQLEYVLLSPGKRLRPIMLLTSTQTVGGETKKAIPLALSIEVLHTATLVHDDIIDQDQNRRGAPTVHKKWSIGDAILLGDALISLSIKLASPYGPQIVDTIAETGLALSNGEHMELTAPLTTITEAQYFAEIQGKSAALFRAATTCGALVGCGNPSEVEALGEFGERVGLAYQIRDDLDDLKGEDNLISRDLQNGIPTLPIIHLYQNGGPQSRRALEEIFGRRASLSKAHQVMNLLEEKGTILYCEQRIKENIEAARNALSIIKPSEAKNLLLSVFKVINPQEIGSK